MSDITQILSQVDQGDATAAQQLLPLVYDELRQLAAARLAHEQPGQTLQATALVHEAWLRLVRGREAGDSSQETGDSSQETGDREQQTGHRDLESTLSPDSCSLSPSVWNGRGHFFAAAAEAMRRILIERARRKRQNKRGGDCFRVPLEAIEVAEEPNKLAAVDVLALDEALVELENHDSLAAQLVKLRYFAGLTMPEAASALGISLRTAERNWTYARAWLHRRLE